MLTLGTVLLAPALLLIPSLSGAVIERLGHRPVFLAAAGACSAGLLMIWRLYRDTRSRNRAGRVIR
jgi:hypothetical protein